MLHKLAIALILLAVLCFAAVPVLGASLFVVGVGIETVGYLVWGVAFWSGRRPKEPSVSNEGS